LKLISTLFQEFDECEEHSTGENEIVGQELLAECLGGWGLIHWAARIHRFVIVVSWFSVVVIAASRASVCLLL